MKNLINWFEIPVTDMARAIAFYEQVMQKSLRRETMDGADLAVFPYAEPGPGGALIKQDDVAPVAQGVVIYLHTADLLASIERVVLAGGKCVLEPMVPGDDIGTIALFIDSEGNRIGLHQPA
ncbi:VOC family protein [Salmonella enterica]|uniref:VOC family protein n=18 Tax=Salmonella enterica TaxID=28901 RepID=A0A4U7WQG4_SALNE|nr:MULTISPECIES: VOC family protein [Salmonella]EAA0508118.1 VOC family protein [Salmonella enterica subsp. enterica]EAA3638007.1 VOC family protein [Salmonella enterica subsp. enterica serovar Hessarek]EAA5345041.1 VOC family protein [Salmonella enterica subsp. enterica serovar Thompson]EAA5957604.1 VOC family protein [Salmonella enterica subsp. enterica serovar Stanleyville]EAB8533066.1 VOC family protein [Salmonella enterica subsp. enterica serovar Kenya]EBB0741637.1 VOC family protein [Sa